MKRVVIPELLDTDNGTPAEIAANLADLRVVNRWAGGAATMTSLLRRAISAAGGRHFRYLEVAAGSGDVPLYARQQFAREGITLEVTLLDRSALHLPSLPAQNDLPARPVHPRSVAGNALALPFADGSFDFVGCSLFVHHLEPEQVQAFACEALRVARRTVLINDLVRSPLHLALVYLAAPLYRSRLTRHDAPASVRRSYTPDELRQLLATCGASRLQVSRHYLYRMGVILSK